jgi:phosphorylcholine metabolism protein LicD
MEEYKKEDFYLPKSFYKKLYRTATVVNNILVTNNIQYWTEAGTLLGVIRNKGIIPWDDDIDIKVWHKDWIKLLKPDFVKQFKDAGYTIVKESGLNLIKVFPSNAKHYRKNYGFPFVDIFSVSLDKKDTNKVVYTHKWARNAWPNDYLFVDEMYPLKYEKFGASKIVIPNHSKEYLTRLFGKNWNKEGRIYQSHYLRIDLKNPIIVKGPFRPAEDFDYKEIILFPKKILKFLPFSNK